MKLSSINDNELLNFALLGAATQATYLRNTRTESSELRRIECQIIPELSAASFKQRGKKKKQ